MKAHPILFRDEMVRALLDGRKTQTRRVVKPQPPDDWHPCVGTYHPTKVDRHGDEYPGAPIFGASDEQFGLRCPYGQPGDLLWVREAHAVADFAQDSGKGVMYRADFVPGAAAPLKFMRASKWTPSIHMPRAASRLTLRVTGVRVERVQAISQVDAQAEGVVPWDTLAGSGCRVIDRLCDYRRAFETLWDRMRAGTPFAWCKNPWVWVVEFEVIRANVDDVLKERSHEGA